MTNKGYTDGKDFVIGQYDLWGRNKTYKMWEMTILQNLKNQNK